MQVPYSIASYRRADLPQIKLVNNFVEKTPASAAQVALLARPGLAAYADIGTGPIRGIFTQPGALDGDIFSVSGAALFRDTASIGTIPGGNRVWMSASLNTLMIANDTALYSSDGATVSAVAFPDGAGVTSVGYINGFTFATRADSRRIYFTQDPDVWDGLDYISAETSTGNIIAAVVVSDQIWVFCEKVTEVFVTTGDATAPFQRVEGRLYDKGCLARDTIVKLDNSVMWVGHDGIVYRGDSIPTRISDHGIEERISASLPEDLRAWSFPLDGHLFYSLTTGEGTFPYDAATQQWTEFGSYGRDAWRAHIGVFRDMQVIAGDDELGRLWLLDRDALMDGEDVIERWHTVLIAQEGFLDTFVMDAAAGMVTNLIDNPMIELRTSRDQGMTFGTFRQTTLGRQGQYRKRVAWRRLGLIDGEGMVIQIRLTDSTPWRLSSARINEALGGRGRPG